MIDDEYRYTLHQITGVMGDTVKSMRERGALDTSALPREFEVFLNEVVGRLKAVAASAPQKPVDLASPND